MLLVLVTDVISDSAGSRRLEGADDRFGSLACVFDRLAGPRLEVWLDIMDEDSTCVQSICTSSGTVSGIASHMKVDGGVEPPQVQEPMKLPHFMHLSAGNDMLE
jgi:hypothetical protein